MIQKVKSADRKISSPDAVAHIAWALLASEHEIDADKEHFWVFGLNTKNQVKYVDLVTLGVLDASLVHPREVFRLAVHQGVSSIMLCHNHPSGDCTPSREDKIVTERLADAGKVLGIQVIDHVIVGNGTVPLDQHSDVRHCLVTGCRQPKKCRSRETLSRTC